MELVNLYQKPRYIFLKTEDLVILLAKQQAWV
jgi:hypothetical protein